jgi:hypothetical protein
VHRHYQVHQQRQQQLIDLFLLLSPTTCAARHLSLLIAVPAFVLSDVAGFQVGDAVVYMTRSAYGGSYADFTAVKADTVTKLPQGVSTQAAAAVLLQVRCLPHHEPPSGVPDGGFCGSPRSMRHMV